MNKVLEYCLPVFHYLAPFLLPEHDRDVISVDYREGLVAQFIQFEREACAYSISQSVIEAVKYALTALTDECVLYSSWSGKTAWMQRSLQLQFFGEHRAGEGFFERLSQLRQSGHIEIDALEIYALCLQCGFQGTYRFNDHTQFIALKAGLESQIQAIRNSCREASDLLLSVPLILHPTKKAMLYEKSLWWIGSVMIGIIFCIGIAYRYAELKLFQQAVIALQQDEAYDS